jgi:hypothetical protein
MNVLPFWVEFGIIVAGTLILFGLSLWIARKAERRGGKPPTNDRVD